MSEKTNNTIPLRVGDKQNFQTIMKAAENGDLALVSAVRNSDQANVGLVCAMSAVEDLPGETMIMPLAVMVEGNPFDMYTPPGGFDDQDRVQKGKPIASQNAQLLALSRAATAIDNEAKDLRHNEDFRLAAATLASELSGRAHALTIDMNNSTGHSDARSDAGQASGNTALEG